MNSLHYERKALELTPLDVVDRAKQCLALIFERLETIASRRLNSPAINMTLLVTPHQRGMSVKTTLRQTCSREYSRAPFALENSMIR